MLIAASRPSIPHVHPVSACIMADREREAARILNPAATAYEVLGVPPNATHEQIAAQHRELRVRWHPDKHRNSHERATQIFQKIEQAWDTLQDPSRRAKYDQELRRQAVSQDAFAGEGSIGATLRSGAYGRILKAMEELPRGLADDLLLPQIVVVGSESAGKSSLMERIAMQAFFPRAEGFCTRMAIRLKMMHRPHESRVMIRCLRTSNGQVAMFNGMPAEQRFEVDGVQHTVIQRIIERFIAQVHGQDDGRSVLTDIEIEIEFRACNVPTLTLVDLPGIVSMPADVRQQTLELTRRYLRDPNTLVLCVINGNEAALRGSRALEEISEHAVARPAFSKTIVVTTRTDLWVQSNGLVSLARRLADPKNEVGCEPVALIPVINREAPKENQVDGYSLPDLVKKERAKFEEWQAKEPGLRGKPLGILSVLDALNDLFETHMSEVWVPQAKRKLIELRAATKKQLGDFG
ncbi:hypothetical protein EMIHUDRAFT_631932, partial [Emiliania huxleyi CCMP1516]|uniref:J domain-containing protein n=2 Tax=Emiliania huxleyi TaxID=2903 RepID=A0A0D3KAN9_EMIH1